MRVETVLTRRLKLAHPVVQAPLAGGGDTPDLVAAVSNTGALGFIGAAYLTPKLITTTAATVRARTSRPFGINLFAPLPPSQSDASPEAMLHTWHHISVNWVCPLLPCPRQPPAGSTSNWPPLSKVARLCSASPLANCLRAPSKLLKPETCS